MHPFLPTPRETVLQETIDLLSQELRKQAPLTAKQQKTIDLIRTIAEQLTEDGRTTVGQIIDKIIPVSRKKSAKQQSKSTALLRAKNDINALFAEASMNVTCCISPEARRGNDRSVWFHTAETAHQKQKKDQPDPIVAMDKGAVISALALVLQRMPLGFRTPLRTIQAAYSIAATLDGNNSTTAGVAYQYFHDKGATSSDRLGQRLWKARSVINDIFARSEIPVAMHIEGNRHAGASRALYFLKTSADHIPPIEQVFVPKNREDATKLFRKFVEEFRQHKV